MALDSLSGRFLNQRAEEKTLQTHYLDGQIFRNFMDLQLHQEIGQIEVLNIETKVRGTMVLPTSPPCIYTHRSLAGRCARN